MAQVQSRTYVPVLVVEEGECFYLLLLICDSNATKHSQQEVLTLNGVYTRIRLGMLFIAVLKCAMLCSNLCLFLYHSSLFVCVRVPFRSCSLARR